MHARWLIMGNDAEFAICRGGVQAFNAFPIASGRRANRRSKDFNRRVINPDAEA